MILFFRYFIIRIYFNKASKNKFNFKLHQLNKIKSMKNVIILTALLITSFTNRLNAQAYTKEDISVSIAYGFPNSIGLFHSSGYVFPIYGLNLGFYSQWDGYKTSTLGPIFLNIEKGITGEQALGLRVVYASRKIGYLFSSGAGADTIDYNCTFNTSTLEIFLTRTKHFGNFDQFDPYYRTGLGYRKGFYTATSDGPYPDISTFRVFPIGFLFTIGAQYYILENLGFYLEAGYSSTILLMGINFRL